MKKIKQKNWGFPIFQVIGVVLVGLLIVLKLLKDFGGHL